MILYNFAVQKLGAESSYTLDTMQLMVDSFPKRQYWIPEKRTTTSGCFSERIKYYAQTPLM